MKRILIYYKGQLYLMVAPNTWWDTQGITAFGIGGQQAANNAARRIMLEMKLYPVKINKWDVLGYTRNDVLDVTFITEPDQLLAVVMAAGPSARQLVNAFISRIKLVTRLD